MKVSFICLRIEKSFRIKWLCTQPRFETEAWSNWEMAYNLFCLHVSMRVIKQKIDLICLIKYREYDRQNCTTQGKGTVPLMVYIFRYKTGIWEWLMSWLLYKRVGTSVLDQEKEWGHHPAIRKVNIFQLSCTETGGNKKVTDLLCEQIVVKNLV